jgi:integrase
VRKALTQAAIARLRPGDYLADAHVPGLRVEAFKSNKSFTYRFNDMATGRQRQVKVGDVAEMAIADARDAVQALKRARDEGKDPQAIIGTADAEAVAVNMIEAQQAGYTVKQLIDAYATEHLGALRKGWERERAMRQDLKRWYTRQAASVSRKELKALLEAIALRAPQTSGRVLRELRSAYLHGIDRERLPQGCDPTHGVKAPKASRYVPRDRAFNEREWRAWFEWLPTSGISSDVQDALRLIALTAARPGEVTAAKWADIDIEGRTWVIRARKRDHSHTVHLNPQAIAILSRRRPDDVAAHPLVFPSPTRHKLPMRQHALVWAIANARAGCGLEHWTAHDLRRSAVTLLGEMGYSTDLLGRILGHYSIRRPTDIYVRSTRDVEAKKAWADLGTKLAEFAQPQPVRMRA